MIAKSDYEAISKRLAQTKELAKSLTAKLTEARKEAAKVPEAVEREARAVRELTNMRKAHVALNEMYAEAVTDGKRVTVQLAITESKLGDLRDELQAASEAMADLQDAHAVELCKVQDEADEEIGKAEAIADIAKAEADKAKADAKEKVTAANAKVRAANNKVRKLEAALEAERENATKVIVADPNGDRIKVAALEAEIDMLRREAQAQ
jgi:chromosome segregation ATPase